MRTLGTRLWGGRHKDCWVHTHLSLSSQDAELRYFSTICSSLWLCLKVRAIIMTKALNIYCSLWHTHSVSHFSAGGKIKCTLQKKTPDNKGNGILFMQSLNTLHLAFLWKCHISKFTSKWPCLFKVETGGNICSKEKCCFISFSKSRSSAASLWRLLLTCLLNTHLHADWRRIFEERKGRRVPRRIQADPCKDILYLEACL